MTSSCAPEPAQPLEVAEADVSTGSSPMPTPEHPLAAYFANPAAFEHLAWDGPPPQELVAVAQALLQDPRYVQIQLASLSILDRALTVQEQDPAAVAAYLAVDPRSDQDLLGYPPALGAASGDAALVHSLSVELASEDPHYSEHPVQVHMFATLVSPVLSQTLYAILASHPSTAGLLRPDDDAASVATRLYQMQYAMMRADQPPEDPEEDPPAFDPPPIEPPDTDWLQWLPLTVGQFMVDMTIGNILGGLGTMVGIGDRGTFLGGWARFALGVVATYALPTWGGALILGAAVYALVRLVFEPIVNAMGAFFQAWLDSGLWPGRHPDDECRRDSDCQPGGWCRKGPLGLGQNTCEPDRARGEPCRRGEMCTSGRCRLRLLPPRRECR